ncbi:MAG: membrane protein YdbS with pleckstrin-like domain [Myxococcota bacterium]|jgi:membrane protein YdbS with pleckstrin-like domain
MLFQVPLSIGLAVMVTTFSTLVIGVVVGSIFAFVQLMLALWMPSLSFNRWRYQLREDDILIERGVLLRRLTSIPYSRVQHVDTHQGVLEQSFGLARVHVFTAAGVGADGTIPGLDLEDAEALRDALVERGGGDDGL